MGDRSLQDLLAILVVEDDPLIQSVVEETLMEGGFEVAIVSSGQRAVELLDGTEAKYRALVTDVNLGRNKMERMGGSKARQRNRTGISYCLYDRRQFRRLGFERSSKQHLFN